MRAQQIGDGLDRFADDVEPEALCLPHLVLIAESIVGCAGALRRKAIDLDELVSELSTACCLRLHLQEMRREVPLSEPIPAAVP